MPKITNDVVTHVIVIVVIVLIGLLVFGKALTIGYMADDYDLFAAIEKSGYSPFDVFPAGTGTYFRPLVMFSLSATHAIDGERQEFFHHLANLVVHLCNGWLIFCIVQRLAKHFVLALGLSLLFLFHPANVTNVYWLSGRTDSLVTLFFLLALFGILGLLRNGAAHYVLLTTLGVLGAVLSKESGVVTIGVLWLLFILDQINRPNEKKLGRISKWKSAACLIFVTVVSLSYLLYVYRHFYVQAEGALFGGIESGLEAAGSFILYLLYPNNETAVVQLYRNHSQLFILTAATLLLIALFAAGWMLRSGSRNLFILLLGLGIVVTVLAPFILVLGGITSRLLYLPLSSLCIAFAIWATVYRKLGTWVGVLLLALAPLLMLLSYREGEVWVSNWELTQSYCQTFRDVAGPDINESRLLVLNWPYEASDTSVFSNDLNGALYHCHNNRFGHFENYQAYLPVSATQSEDFALLSTVENQRPEFSQIAFQVVPDVHYIQFFTGTPGDVFNTEFGSVTIDSVSAEERVENVTFDILYNQLLASQVILLFDSTGFSQLWPHE